MRPARPILDHLFTHISPTDTTKPAMVTITHKAPTLRTAIASSTVTNLPPHSLSRLSEVEGVIKAGATTGAVQTYKLIPFCHPLEPLDISTQVTTPSPTTLGIMVTATTKGKTGVEMEALAGAAFAGLAATKALGGGEISRTYLTHKSGGKSGAVDYDVYGRKSP